MEKQHDLMQAEQQEAREPSAAEAIDSLTQPLCVISLRGDDRQKALANDLAKIILQYQGGNQEAQGAQAGDERECNCPKIGERFSAEKHGGPCPVHDAVRGAEQ